MLSLFMYSVQVKTESKSAVADQGTDPASVAPDAATSTGPASDSAVSMQVDAPTEPVSNNSAVQDTTLSATAAPATATATATTATAATAAMEVDQFTRSTMIVTSASSTTADSASTPHQHVLPTDSAIPDASTSLVDPSSASSSAPDNGNSVSAIKVEDTPGSVASAPLTSASAAAVESAVSADEPLVWPRVQALYSRFKVC